MHRHKVVIFLSIFCTMVGCTLPKQKKTEYEKMEELIDSLGIHTIDSLDFISILLEKELLYDKYTLEDQYKYLDKEREFQWDKIKNRLAYAELIQTKKRTWGVLQNYKNRNGEAVVVPNYVRNAYGRVSDTLGVERYQSVPLYYVNDTTTAIRYGRDGWIVEVLDTLSVDFITVKGISFNETWKTPKRYLKILGDTLLFNQIIFVDVTNQNITTIEKQTSYWSIRSMNPATTGRHRPPYAQETPTGLFLLQEKKPKMLYLKDGSSALGGFAPHANRFTNGAYIHGVPVAHPGRSIIEYSYSLGTTPRSHMCVRNVSSHAQFIYEWGPVNQTLIYIID